MNWERTGDPLGDFIRLIGLLEQALERIGAPPKGTLGEKLNSEAVRDFLHGLPDGAELRGKLFGLLEVRNRVLHERAAVPPEALKEGPRVVRRLLAHLEVLGFYREQPIREISPPQPLLPVAEPLEPDHTIFSFEPPAKNGKPAIPFPKRRFTLRRLLLPRRVLP
ncbi:MAG: hypothetical protein C4328_11970 [Meiothermus sp.]